MRTDLKILMVAGNEEATAERLRLEFQCLVDYDGNPKRVFREKNPGSYNIAIVDASDDFCVNGAGSPTLSEWLKSKNSNMIIIGTSVLGEYFRNDRIARQQYDQRISLAGCGWLGEEVKRVLIRKYGFEFPEQVEARA